MLVLLAGMYVCMFVCMHTYLCMCMCECMDVSVIKANFAIVLKPGFLLDLGACKTKGG